MIEADEMGERVPEKMSQRTQVVLHIGMNKTGTSSIQSSLHRNAARLWTQHRILYPLAGRVTRERRYHDHRLLAWSSIRRYSHHFGVPISDIYWAELAAEIEARQPRLCVISSEYFWPAQAAEIDRIKSFLGCHQTTIVFYVRNLLHYAVSSYKQCVKKQKKSDTFGAHIRKHLWMYDYASTIRNWSERFGRERFHLKLYDQLKYDLVRNFFESLGVTDAAVTMKFVTANVSPTEDMIALLRLLNKLDQGAHIYNPLVQKARKNLLKRRFPWIAASRLAGWIAGRPLAKPEEIDWLREATQAKTNEFLHGYVQEGDWPLFAF